ncbi:MAG TPA: SDR family oxidoreductase [Dehalococcoidia bacterium]|nr:SDR family oxidoreductase [Dehalococcoidia bacterium]
MTNVLITGCSSGFGLLTALEFARRGDRVFATMRNTSRAGALRAAADAERLAVTVLPLDVLDDASVTAAVKQATDAAGPIDVLVNNAGFALRSPIEEADDDEIRAQFDTNVFGTMRVIRAVLPSMRERRAGTIVNVSSIGGIVGAPYEGFYSATKHALEAISEVMHYELSSFGVRVIVIEPGGFDTQFGDNIIESRRFAAPDSPYRDLAVRFREALGKLRAPDGVPGDPADVARTICDAVADPNAKLRYLVGGDAQVIAAVRRQTDFEGFEAAMRQTLDWHD